MAEVLGIYMGNGLKMIERNEYEYTVEYTLNKQLHRPNGPAFERVDGFWIWWLYGKPHRYYGPQNYKVEKWYLHGCNIK